MNWELRQRYLYNHDVHLKYHEVHHDHTDDYNPKFVVQLHRSKIREITFWILNFHKKNAFFSKKLTCCIPSMSETFSDTKIISPSADRTSRNPSTACITKFSNCSSFSTDLSEVINFSLGLAGTKITNFFFFQKLFMSNCWICGKHLAITKVTDKTIHYENWDTDIVVLNITLS